MEEFWRNTVDQAQAYGPQLIKAALVMIAFIIGAFIVRWLIAAAIDRTGLAKKANASTATSDSKSLGTSLAQAAFWVTILIGLMQALAIAGATQISSALHGVIDPILSGTLRLGDRTRKHLRHCGIRGIRRSGDHRRYHGV